MRMGFSHDMSNYSKEKKKKKKKKKKKSLLLKLIGIKEEVVVPKEIQKALKQSPPTYLPRNSVISRGPSRGFR